ncbi:DNA cytosine methyltransferase [Pseudomonas veronii]|uniref:DNA cytosine methyltransferase n=1 Tax=Pseudomonas veronii TaxID=76761 RepID=UPI0006978DEB|nr:DNA cytosine methyltransferase [Pseudomonas veronii]
MSAQQKKSQFIHGQPSMGLPFQKELVVDLFAGGGGGGASTGILWASPDCRHHSKAKGYAPRDRGVRGLAWVVVHWAHATRPRLMFLENVEEFCDWGPIDESGQPIKAEHADA